MMGQGKFTLAAMAEQMREEEKQGTLQHITNGLKEARTPQYLGKRLEQLEPILEKIVSQLGTVGYEIQRHYTIKINGKTQTTLKVPLCTDGSVYMKGKKQWKWGIEYGQGRKGIKTVIQCTATIPSVIRTFILSENAADQAEIPTIQEQFSQNYLTTGDKAFLSKALMEHADRKGTYYLIGISRSFTQKKLTTTLSETSYGPVQDETIRVGGEKTPQDQWIVRKLTYIKREKQTVKVFEWVTNNWELSTEELRETAERHWIIEQFHQQVQETFALHRMKLRNQQRVKALITLAHLLGQLYTLYFLRTQKEGEPYVFQTIHKTVHTRWKQRIMARMKTYTNRFPEKRKEQKRAWQKKEQEQKRKQREQAKHALKTRRISSRGQDRADQAIRQAYEKEKSTLFYDTSDDQDSNLQSHKHAEEKLQEKQDANARLIWFTLCCLYPQAVTRETLQTLTTLPRTTLFDGLKRLEKEKIVHVAWNTEKPKKGKNCSSHPRRGRPYTLYSLKRKQQGQHDDSLQYKQKPPPDTR